MHGSTVVPIPKSLVERVFATTILKATGGSSQIELDSASSRSDRTPSTFTSNTVESSWLAVASDMVEIPCSNAH